jgi:uncharacterized hydrophobic protein (TIGR00271 family)
MKTILVHLASAAESDILATFILPVARSEQAQVILLHICPIHATHDSTCQDDASEESHWLNEAAREFETTGVTVQIHRREAHSIAGGIRDAVSEFKPALLALSWRRSRENEYDTALTLQELLLDVPCDLVVWRGEQAAPPPHRVLIPSAGGPNVQVGFRLAEDFHRAYGSKIIMLTVVALDATPQQVDEARAALEARTRTALESLQVPWDAVQLQVVKARTPVAGILKMAAPTHADVVILGASEEGVLHRLRFGEIPEKIAAQARVPVLIIKRPLPRRITLYRRALDAVLRLTPNATESEKIAVYREARRNARQSHDFFTMIALSTAIATLGLMLNAPAVIIGAMLIAPLMSAIVAMGLGIVLGDARLLKLGARTTAAGVAATLLVSFLMELLIPFDTLTHEMLARSSPNLLDLGVALAAGAAGAYALARKNVSSSLPGVAIAVALIPPIATTGMALALGQWSVALGAGLLFVTNLVGIVGMSSFIFLSMNFMPGIPRRDRMRLFARGWQITLLLILAVSIPLALVTARQVRQLQIKRAIETEMQAELRTRSAIKLRTWHYQEQGQLLNLDIEIEAQEPISMEQAADMQMGLAQRLQRPVALTLKTIPSIHLPASP